MSGISGKYGPEEFKEAFANMRERERVDKEDRETRRRIEEWGEEWVVGEEVYIVYGRDG